MIIDASGFSFLIYYIFRGKGTTMAWHGRGSVRIFSMRSRLKIMILSSKKDNRQVSYG